jgi:hypothetical protein
MYLSTIASAVKIFTNRAKKFHKKQVKLAEEEKERHEDALKFKKMLSPEAGA